MQGNFRVYTSRRSGTAASNGLPGVSALESGRFSAYHGTTLPLDQLESRIQGAKSQ
jgi:hypothetical protein